MKRIPIRMDIENRILIPFVCISLATVICFCAILYFTQYTKMLDTQQAEAEAMLGYIRSDLELEDYRQQPERLLEKYRSHYSGNNLYIRDRTGELLLGSAPENWEELETLAQTTDARLGWTISYRVDRERILTFGINLGWNSLTEGAARIRELLGEENVVVK